MAGSPVTMGHPIRRVRVPSLSANFNEQWCDGRLVWAVGFSCRVTKSFVAAMERSLAAKAMAGSPVTMGHPIRRVRVPSLSANSFDSHAMGGSIGRGSDRRQLRSTQLHDHGFGNGFGI
jgi:hypothetical protein